MKQTIQDIKQMGAKVWAEQNLDKIEYIKGLIVKCATAYYEGTALITDADFECFVDVIKSVNPNDEILTIPGWGYKITNGSKHLYGKIGSLPYYFDYDELKNNFQNNSQIIITPKFDGINFVAYFDEGKFDKCLTRGNGYVGKDISWAFKNYSLPDELKQKSFAINGEAICYMSTDLNINFRDTVAEYLNNESNIKNNNIEFMPFNLLNLRLNNYLDTINLINKFSKIKIRFKLLNNLPTEKELKNIFDEYSKAFKIDGLVITENKTKKQIAFKYRELI